MLGGQVRPTPTDAHRRTARTTAVSGVRPTAPGDRYRLLELLPEILKLFPHVADLTPQFGDHLLKRRNSVITRLTRHGRCCVVGGSAVSSNLA